MSQQKGDIIFIDGLICKEPTEAQAGFLVARQSVKLDEFIEFANRHQRDGWLNIDVRRSKKGGIYAALNTWQPTQGEAATQGMEQARKAAEPAPASVADDDIPF